MNRWWIATAASLVLLAGCGQEAIDFNNQVATVHARLGVAVEAFGRVLRPALDEGQPPTEEELAAAMERLRSEMAAASERSDQLRVPPIAQAEELYAAHRECLAGQQALLERELAEIERLLALQLTPGELHERLRARFQALKAEESKQLETMHAAQQRFAEANRLKLTKPAE
jgi:hypothetical protein